MASPRLRSRLRNERGAAIVEFAACSIVFFMFVFGTAEYGRMVFDYNIVSTAAREGARWASARGATSGHQASASDVKSYVAGRSMGRLSSSDVTVTWPDTLGNEPGGRVVVQTQRNFQPIVGVLPAGLTTLRSTASMIIGR